MLNKWGINGEWKLNDFCLNPAQSEGARAPKRPPKWSPKLLKMGKVLKKSAAKSGLEIKPEKRKSTVWESCSRPHGSSISKVPRHSKKHAKSSPNGTRNNSKVNTRPKLREREKHVKKKGRQVGEYAEKKRLQAKWDPSETQNATKKRKKWDPKNTKASYHAFALKSVCLKVCTQQFILKSLYSKACAQKFVLKSLY